MEIIKKNNTVFTLSVFISVLAATAALGGLLLRSLYRDSEFVATSWRANDMITLFIALPLLITSMYYAWRGSQRWYMVWMGLLLYMLYNYSFYLFGAAFNKFFLIYVSLFALSVYAFIIGIFSVNTSKLNIHFNSGIPGRVVATYLLLVTIPLLIGEGSQCLNFIISEKQPAAPPLIFALDLSIVVPASLIAAWQLWKRSKWGYLLAVIILVKGFVYGLVLSIGTGILAYSDVFGKWDKLLPFYIFVAIGGFMGALLLLKKMDINPIKC